VEKHAPASCRTFADSPAFRELKTTTGSPIRMNVMVDLLSVPDVLKKTLISVPQCVN
jgi:hypothetical protein